MSSSASGKHQNPVKCSDSSTLKSACLAGSATVENGFWNIAKGPAEVLEIEVFSLQAQEALQAHMLLFQKEFKVASSAVFDMHR
jgi:hypothetical protein